MCKLGYTFVNRKGTHMKLHQKSLFYILGVFALGLSTAYTQAQQVDGALDPAGYVNKYDTDFDGVGPRVYILPAPRTREELLTDSYKEKVSFQASIEQALDFEQLIAEFTTTSAERNVQYLLSPMPSTALAWNELVEREVERGNYNAAYGLLHTYASLSLKEGTISQTLGLLQSALSMHRRHQMHQMSRSFNIIFPIFICTIKISNRQVTFKKLIITRLFNRRVLSTKLIPF